MICSVCGEDKNERLFATYKSRTGELRRRGVCWQCKNDQCADYQQKNFDVLQSKRRACNVAGTAKKRERDQKRRRAIKDYIDQVKNVPCMDCGRCWPPVAMDLDHVRGVKVRSVASLVAGAYSLDIVKAEVLKCEVVCACCHRIRTHCRNDYLPQEPVRQMLSTADLANDQRSTPIQDRYTDRTVSNFMLLRETTRQRENEIQNRILDVVRGTPGLRMNDVLSQVGSVDRELLYRLLCRLRGRGLIRVEGRTHQTAYFAVSIDSCGSPRSGDVGDDRVEDR